MEKRPAAYFLGHMKKIAALILAICFLQPGFARAAEGDAAVAAASVAGAKNPDADVKRNVDADYLIKSGDKINIKIFPEDQYIRGGQYEVTPEGNVTLPLIGKVIVAGKTISEASDDLRQIIDKDYIISPEVVIELLGYKVETFVVLGQVQKPGTLNMPAGATELTFLQAISLAGGFSQIANIKKVKIIRVIEGQRKIIRLNAESIISGEAEDIRIEPGDVIHVSESMF